MDWLLWEMTTAMVEVEGSARLVFTFVENDSYVVMWAYPHVYVVMWATSRHRSNKLFYFLSDFNVI